MADQWTIDRRIPLGLIFSIFGAILLQTCAVVWWASALQVEQEKAAAERESFHQRLVRIETSRDDLLQRLIRVEEKITGQNQTLREILESVRREQK